MKNWKIFFIISIILLIISNITWAYQTLDLGIARNYEKITCEEWKSDAKNLESILKSFKTKNQIFEFLNSNNIKYEKIEKEKGNENYIVLGSFSILYNDLGEVIGLEPN